MREDGRISLFQSHCIGLIDCTTFSPSHPPCPFSNLTPESTQFIQFTQLSIDYTRSPALAHTPSFLPFPLQLLQQRGSAAVPRNFQPTVPPHDPAQGPKAKGRMPTKFDKNPQVKRLELRVAG